LSVRVIPGQLEAARVTLRGRRIGAVIARTATFNVAAAVTAALGGVILARALGPTARGEYAAVIAWFGILLVIGEMGQSAAVCFYAARDPLSARDYVATSRAMMLVTGAVAMAGGLLLAPVLAHGNPGLADAYRIAFAGSAVTFTGTSYTFSLQARSIGRWNLVRLSQPVLSLAAVIVLWRLRLLSLQAVLYTLAVTMTIQLGFAYYHCRRCGLAPGRVRAALVRPLATYGLSQLAAITPASVNLLLDQLVLSQLVPAADLARYSIAASITLVPVPLVSAIGNVAFPRLAAQRTVTLQGQWLQRAAVLTSAGLAFAILAPVVMSSYWVIPLVFGPAYRGAVPLLWILAPGGVFMASSQVAGDLLRGRDRPGLVAVAQSVAAVFTVVLLIVLLPSMGVAAAAIASTVAYGVALAVMIRCLWRLPQAGQAAGPAGDQRDPGAPPTPPRRARGSHRRERAILPKMPPGDRSGKGDLCALELSGRPGRTPSRRTSSRGCPRLGTTRCRWARPIGSAARTPHERH
jgi:O-antigen/teichoic acid export membrane protein